MAAANPHNNLDGMEPKISFNEVGGMFDWVDQQMKLVNPRVVVIIIAMCVLFYFIVTTLGGSINTNGDGNRMNGSGDSSIMTNSSIIEILLWSIFIVIVLMNGFQYFFNTNITTEVSNLLSTTPQIRLTNTFPEEPTATGGDLGSVSGTKMKKQVFHIPASVYDYDNAKALCQAYGANLANIDQMEEAHKSGAEWCSYGWSDNQMILYPTQKSTWTALQKDPAKKNSCGRPGINGGYIDNASMKAGVNCYGSKPDMNESSSKLMANIQNYESGKMFDPLHEARINEMRSKINDIVIAPFNKSAWSLL